MFYNYDQNNSGGSYSGPKYIVVEADSPQQADKIAESKTPVYFDGCDSGQDCSCCGDRWSTASYSQVNEVPSFYNIAYPDSQDGVLGWLKDNFETVKYSLDRGVDVHIFYLDGTKKILTFSEEDYLTAKQSYMNQKDFCYGFSWYPKNTEPGHVSKFFYHSDKPYSYPPDFHEYWDSSGNYRLIKHKDSYGWSTPSSCNNPDYNIFYFSSPDQLTAEKKRQECIHQMDRLMPQIQEVLTDPNNKIQDTLLQDAIYYHFLNS